MRKVFLRMLPAVMLTMLPLSALSDVRESLAPHFSSKKWIDVKNDCLSAWSEGDRVRLLADLLSDYDVIGMSRDRIEGLLGKTVEDVYPIAKSCTTNIRLRLQYGENESLKKWRIESVGFRQQDGWADEPWIETNVLLAIKMPIVPIETIPKSVLAK